MVLGKLPVRRHPADLDIKMGMGLSLYLLTALAKGAGGDCLDIFSLFYNVALLSTSLSGRRAIID